MLNRRMFLTTAGATAVATPLLFSTTGCTPNQINQAIADLPVAENAVDIIVSIVTVGAGVGLLTSAALALVNETMAEVKAGLVTVGTYLNTYKSNPNAGVLDDIDTALTSVSKNLQSAFLAAGITDTVTLNTITGLLALIDTFVKLVQTVIPAAATASVVRKTAQQKLKTPSQIPTKEQFASLVNALVVNSRPEYQNLQVSVK